MDIKTKYHYTYFLNPFVVDKNKYEKFLTKLVNDKKWNYRMFNKVKDMEIYTHFLAQAKEFMFPSFYFDDKYKEKLMNLSGKKLARELTKQSAVEFDYDLNDLFQIQGKIEEKEQIFFDISQIRLICFNTGICFLVFKTNILEEDSVSFRDLLNFNYKFKELSSPYAKFKGNDNIYIQTNQFESLSSLSDFINSVTSGYVTFDNDDIYSDRMFVYSYACIDETDWNNENTFEKIEDNFYKYAFQFSGDYSSEIELNDKEYNDIIYSKWKYSKYGFTKLGGVVFCSAIDQFNYTKLPIHYENVSLYIMLLAFYQRVSLLTIENEIKMSKGNNIEYLSKSISNILTQTKINQVSNSEHGMSLWNNWYKAFEIENLYLQLEKEYERWNDKVKEKRKSVFNIVTMLLLLLIYYILLNYLG